MIFDPRQQAAVEDVAGHRGFEFGSADEKDEGMKTVPREAEKLREGLHVEVMLMKRIWEAVFGPVSLLRPLALPLGAEDPASIVFRLDDENAEGLDDDMIDLGASHTVGPWQIEIAERAVKRRV